MIRFSSFYPVKSLRLFNLIYPSLVWNKPRSDNSIYLTFDDGPIPEITPWVLAILSEFDVRATFFCIGSNVEKNQAIYQDIISLGHRVGNHSYSHLNGWKNEAETYIKDVSKAKNFIESNLFRPPYGKITRKQIGLLKKDYQLVMWDVMSGDFDQNCTSKQCIDNVVSNVKNGSIIVMHDNLKSEANLRESLPIILKELLKKGYKFKTL